MLKKFIQYVDLIIHSVNIVNPVVYSVKGEYINRQVFFVNDDKYVL